jgi:hypothetical protein
MAQTTTYFGTSACPKFLYSLSSSLAASGTDISGEIVSLAKPDIDRLTGWVNTWDGDGPVGVYGKRAKSTYVLTCIYTSGSTGFRKDMVAVAEGASLASPLWCFYYPTGSVATHECVTLTGGLVSKVSRPGPDAGKGDLFTYEVTLEFGSQATTVL